MKDDESNIIMPRISAGIISNQFILNFHCHALQCRTASTVLHITQCNSSRR
jgi:hypothetical protein